MLLFVSMYIALSLLIMFASAHTGLSLSTQVALIWIAGFAYGGWLALLTWQALRGQPFATPDRVTLATFTGLLATVLGAMLIVFVL